MKFSLQVFAILFSFSSQYLFGMDAKSLEAPPEETLLSDALNLRGFRIGYHTGEAQAQTTQFDGDEYFTIAAGKASHRYFYANWRLFSQSGWHWSIVPQFTSQNITLQDFPEELPEVYVPGATNIPVFISDPVTGEVLDGAEYSNRYSISMKNLGVLGGIAYRWGSPHRANNFWVVDGGAWLGAVDHVWTEVVFENRRSKAKGFAVLNSARLETNLYYNMPNISSAVGFHISGQYYPKVTMPDSMEFRGVTRYNPNKQVFERRRLFMKEVSFSSMTVGVSYTYLWGV